jgi:thiamine kinase-like enzyme
LDFEASVRRLRPEWNTPEVTVKVLGSGIFNYPLHLVENGKEKYVVKLFGKNTEYFVDRKIEAENIKRLSETGLTQRLVELNEEKRAMILEYLPGRSLVEDDFRDPKIVEMILVTIRKIHNSGIVLANECNVFRRIETWLAKSREFVSSTFAPRDEDILRDFPIDKMLLLSHKIERYLNKFAIKKVPISSDLWAGNVILSPDKNKVWIIDWEPAGNGDPANDIALFIAEHTEGMMHVFSQEDEERILKIYYGADWEEMRPKMILYKFLMAFHWALVGVVQYHAMSEVYDYDAYARDNLKRANRYMQYINQNIPLN